MKLASMPSPLAEREAFAAAVRRAVEAPGAVPALTRAAMATGRLAAGDVVRYRGMVQDIFDPELFATTFVDAETGETRSAMFRDALPPGASVDSSKPGRIAERSVFYVVPVPGETPWVRSLVYPTASSSSSLHEASPAAVAGGEAPRTASKPKRALGGDGADAAALVSPRATPASAPHSSTSPDAAPEHHPQQPPPPRSQAQVDAAAAVALVRDANFPLPGETELPVVLKTYDDDDDDDDVAAKERAAVDENAKAPPPPSKNAKRKSPKRLALGDVVEVMGVLAVDPDVFGGHLNAPAGNDQAMMDEMAFLDGHALVPSSVAPRLHALWWRVVPRDELVPLSLPLPASPGASTDTARATALRWFTAACGGDALAAEYLLLWSISSVAARPADDVCVGKLSLGLCGAAPATSRTLREVLPLLLARFHAVDPSSLNARKLWPAKDATANRLRASRLQTAAGTHVLVDETVLEPGASFDETGVANVRALERLSRAQVLTYEFPFFSREHGVDAPTLVVSSNKSAPALVPVDVVVRLAVSDLPPPFPLASSAASELQASLEAVRSYLHVARARGAHAQLSEAVAKQVESDFVTARARGDASVDESALHAWINTSRAVAASFGSGVVDVDAYARARAMDLERRRRLSS